VVCRKTGGAANDVEKADAGRSQPVNTDMEKASAEAGRSQPVKFQIADDDDDDKPEGTHLLAKPPPYIMIESPSAAKIAGGDSGSPTSV